MNQASGVCDTSEHLKKAVIFVPLQSLLQENGSTRAVVTKVQERKDGKANREEISLNTSVKINRIKLQKP